VLLFALREISASETVGCDTLYVRVTS